MEFVVALYPLASLWRLPNCVPIKIIDHHQARTCLVVALMGVAWTGEVTGYPYLPGTQEWGSVDRLCYQAAYICCSSAGQQQRITM